MRQYTIYECDKCGKTSKSRKEIMQCEAAHLGLTFSEYVEYQHLKSRVASTSCMKAHIRNAETEADFDKAISDLITFEYQHNIKC